MLELASKRVPDELGQGVCSEWLAQGFGVLAEHSFEVCLEWHVPSSQRGRPVPVIMNHPYVTSTTQS